MNIKDIKFRPDLYPRFETSQDTIKKYSDNIEVLPPITVNQNNILIDGFHRWKAHEMAGKTEIKSEIVNTESEAKLKQLAYKYNSHHGLQLTSKEKKHFAIEMIELMPVEEIANIISVADRTVRDWTVNRRKDLEERRNDLILEMYLHGNETERTVSDKFELSRKEINIILGSFGRFAKTTQNPFLYNTWNTQKGNDTEHFGSFPLIFMENLLHYHTKPMDLVFDPFAGNGTTIDACKEMTRRFYCSDLEVKPGREKDIYLHDITTGLPEDLKKPDLAFLDPPYWKQSKGKYIEHKNQLGNMHILEDFNNAMKGLLDELRKRMVNRIAIIIQPTQYANDFVFIDHVFNFHVILSKWYEIEMRYILPYSTEQYHPQNIIKAKEENKCLVLNRDLIIWKVK